MAKKLERGRYDSQREQTYTNKKIIGVNSGTTNKNVISTPHVTPVVLLRVIVSRKQS